MKHRMSVNCWTVTLAGMAAGLLSWLPAQAQESRWATAKDSTAKSLTDFERRWAESACTQNDIKKTILAEDFQGTAPDGTRYSKKDAIAHSLSGKPEEVCTLHEVTVHFFGDAMAILYGSESAVHVQADGGRHTVKLTWTDTWLKRSNATEFGRLWPRKICPPRQSRRLTAAAIIAAQPYPGRSKGKGAARIAFIWVFYGIVWRDCIRS